MPTYRSINIALHSQFDVEVIPEYYPPPLASSASASCNLDPAIPPLVDDSTSTCSVHIPTLPGSQFWIGYSVSPPMPESHFFLFKLYIDGERAMSWSTGKEDGWRGKTMFGLFENEGRCGGAGSEKRRVEKRVLCFSAPDKKGGVNKGCLEIRVHRASGRKRTEREMDRFEETKLARMAGGVSLVNAGRAGPEQPKRFYKFALIDPVDQPFATFRYYYRTWDQLRELGLLSDNCYAESEDNDIPIIEPGEGNSTEESSSDPTSPQKVKGRSARVIHERPEVVNQAKDDKISVRDWDAEARKGGGRNISASMFKQPTHAPSTEHESSRRDNIASGTYVPCGAPASEVTTGSPPPLRRRGTLKTYRLSIPPSIHIPAPNCPSDPCPVPQKNDLLSPTAYRPHPAYPVEEWTPQTPSSVGSTRDGIITPPLAERKGFVLKGAGLLGVISSTWKRSTSGTYGTRKSGLDEGPRSASY